MAGPRLSVVVPIRDEDATLPRTLGALRELLERRGETWELVLVDDGSRDGSREQIEEAAREDPRVRAVVHPRNRGKGAAVRSGVSAAAGERVVFTDADLSADLDALDPLLAALDGGASVAIGSRRVPGAVLERRQGPLRELLGRAFSAAAAWLVAPGVADFTCGLKGFRAGAAREIFARSRVDGWAFDAELVAIARARDIPLVQVPVRWRHEPRTQVRLLRAVPRSAVELLAIVLRRWSGAYGR